MSLTLSAAARVVDPPHTPRIAAPTNPQANILSAAATPDMRWIVGGCMDSTVGPAS